jgi:Rrf2 family protein
MKFSTQEEYGLRCLLQIARVSPDGSLTIPEIAQLEGLSQTHVAKLLMILRRGGLITSHRGQVGGYFLKKPLAEIFVGEVLDVLGGRLYDDRFCNRHRGKNTVCIHAVDCSIRSLWQVVQDQVDDVVGRMPITVLLEKETAPKPNVTFFASRPERVKEA